MDTPFWILVWERARLLLDASEPEQKDIAALTGQSESAVSLWRKGQAPNPRVDTILEIAAGLHIDPDEVWRAVRDSSDELPKGQTVTTTRARHKIKKLSSLPVRPDIAPM
jgi:transcriptional regulator with XRE-family HTH domain